MVVFCVLTADLLTAKKTNMTEPQLDRGKRLLVDGSADSERTPLTLKIITKHSTERCELFT